MGGTELKEGEEGQVNVMTRGEGEWEERVGDNEKFGGEE